MDIVVACKRWGIAWAGVFLFWLAFIFAVETVSICDAESWRPIDITLVAVFFCLFLHSAIPVGFAWKSAERPDSTACRIAGVRLS